LSIDEFRMATDCEVEEELVSSSRFVSLGDHGLCSFDCRSINRMPGPQHMGELVSIRAYTIENPLSHNRLKYGHTLLVSNQWKQVYSVRDSHRGLPCPCLEAVIYLLVSPFGTFCSGVSPNCLLISFNCILDVSSNLS
jgi:hypothetical protein